MPPGVQVPPRLNYLLMLGRLGTVEAPSRVTGSLPAQPAWGGVGVAGRQRRMLPHIITFRSNAQRPASAKGTIPTHQDAPKEREPKSVRGSSKGRSS
jgi:hypothetical protein